MEKMLFETRNPDRFRIEKIKELFPECIQESKGIDGKLCSSINIDLLRVLLNQEVSISDEHYEFSWVGKKEALIERRQSGSTKASSRKLSEQSESHIY